MVNFTEDSVLPLIARELETGVSPTYAIEMLQEFGRSA